MQANLDFLPSPEAYQESSSSVGSNDNYSCMTINGFDNFPAQRRHILNRLRYGGNHVTMVCLIAVLWLVLEYAQQYIGRCGHLMVNAFSIMSRVFLWVSPIAYALWSWVTLWHFQNRQVVLNISKMITVCFNNKDPCQTRLKARCLELFVSIKTSAYIITIKVAFYIEVCHP